MIHTVCVRNSDTITQTQVVEITVRFSISLFIPTSLFSRGSKLCVMTEKEEKECLVNKCPQDCAFRPWSDWGACSTTCGKGARTRTRTIGR